MYHDLGDYARAEPLFREAIEIEQRTGDRNNPTNYTTLNNLARVYQALGDYARAEPLYRRALEISGANTAEKHPRHAVRLNNLGGLYLEMGDYAKAEPLLQRAREISKRTLGENHPEYVATLNNLAELFQQAGDYAKAEALLREAVAITTRALSENHPLYATSLNNLAWLYRAMGDHARAEPLIRRALEIRRRAIGENHPLYLNSLASLGSVCHAEGDYANAETLLKHAVEIAKRAPGENHPDYAIHLNNLAALYESMGDYAKAEPLLQKALEVTKGTVGDNHPNYSVSLNNLAELFQHAGDYAKAESLYRQAVETAKQSPGENHPNYAISLSNLALLFYARGELAKSEQSLAQGLTLLTRWARDGLAVLGERQRIRLLEAHCGALFAYLSVALAAGTKSDELYRQLVACKGVVEARQIEDRLVRDRPELRETLGELEQVRARLAHVAFTTPTVSQRLAWLKQLEALRDRKENLESDLARKSALFQKIRETQWLGADEVAAALPPGSTFLVLLEYGHLSPPVGGKGRFRVEKRLLAFVLRRGHVPVLVPLGASQPIDQAVETWRAGLVAGAPEPMHAAAVELNRLVWQPLKPHLQGATTLLVAPDGALTQFPLAALPGQRAGTYLIEDLAIGYVSSAHRLVKTLAAPSEASPKAPRPIPPVCYRRRHRLPGRPPASAAPAESAPTPSTLLADSVRAGLLTPPVPGPEVSLLCIRQSQIDERFPTGMRIRR